MSYILPDEFQECLIEDFRAVMTDKQIKNARFSCAKKQTKSYKEICKKMGWRPDGPDVIIAWFHLGNRYLRGLI